jgi:hypothetical protein
MLPKTVEWSELGLPGIPRTQPKIEPGSSSFRRLSEKEQRRLIGPARLKMFKSGTKLKDLLHVVPNGKWGPMAKFKTLGQTVKAPPKIGGPHSADDYTNMFKMPGADSTAAQWQQWSNMQEKWAEKWAYPGMTAAERLGLTRYQGSTYRDINAALRGSWKVDKDGPLNDWITGIDSAMKKSKIGTAAFVYRGTNMDSFGAYNAADMKALIGTTIKDPAYFSTAMFNPFKKQVQMELSVPKGTKGVWMSNKNVGDIAYKDGTPYNGENELLLDRGTKIAIDDVYKKTEKDPFGNEREVWIVKGRVVGQDQDPFPTPS